MSILVPKDDGGSPPFQSKDTGTWLKKSLRRHEEVINTRAVTIAPMAASAVAENGGGSKNLRAGSFIGDAIGDDPDEEKRTGQAHRDR